MEIEELVNIFRLESDRRLSFQLFQSSEQGQSIDSIEIDKHLICIFLKPRYDIYFHFFPCVTTPLFCLLLIYKDEVII